MPSSPPLSADPPWTVDPVRDFVSFRLIALAVAALDFAFRDDRTGKAYERWLKSGPRKPRRRGASAVPPPPLADSGRFELHAWRRPGGHAVEVLAERERGEFVVVVEEEEFSADIIAVYDPDLMEVVAAGVDRFAGDRLKAADVARQFVDMLEHLGGFDEAVPGGPGGPVADVIAARVIAIADRLASGLAGRSGDAMRPDDERFLAETPEALWAIRDGLIERAGAKRRPDAKLLLAWQTLLERQLEEIRFKAERRHGWALAMIERYQTDLLDMAHRPGVDINTWQALVIVLDRAKIDIRPDVRAASLDLAAGVGGNGPAGVDIMRSMEEIVESGGGDPFRIATHLFDAMTMMPADFANAAVAMISDAPLPALRDVLPLVLLAPEAGCREAATVALERMAAEKRLTPAGLRRLIALRSWLPEAERRGVDQTIRRARLAGVDCAAWPTGQVRTLLATVIDGSGCQSLISLAKDGNRSMFAGLLTKQGFGVRDVITERGLTKRDGESMLAAVGTQVLTRAVARPYFDRAVQHALWTGVDAGRAPPLALLEVAEILGAAEWRAERLDAQAEVGRLLADAPAGATEAAALRRSGDWIGIPDLAGSWFEDDELARDVCARLARTPRKAATAVLAEVIEPRRALWAERLVWMALWTQAGGAVPGLPDHHDFALVARALYDGKPLGEVPLMTGVARLTVERAG